MNSSLIDPNNHVPKVSPDDGWDDADGFTQIFPAGATILPPRRTLSERAIAERAASSAADSEPTGLRIESNITRRESGDVAQRLEVQEIGGGVVRLEQTAPAPPKVARQVVFQERQPEENPAKNPGGEGRDWGLAHNHSMRWILGTSVGITAVIVLSLMMLPLINKSNAARISPADQQEKVVEEEKIEGMDAVNQLLSKQSEAEQIFGAYAKARIADQVMALIPDPEAQKQTIRKNWHPLGVPNNWQPDKTTTWQALKANGYAYGLLEGTLPDYSKFAAYFVNKENHLLLDWKATSAFGTATFDELSKSQGDASEIRGLVLPSNFYTTTWPEADYRCYQLIAPVGETTIWCYARRTAPAEIALAELFQNGEILQEKIGARKVTVKLEHGPAGALPNQWLVSEMLQNDWITP